MRSFRRLVFAILEFGFRGLGRASLGAVHWFDRQADWCAERAR